MRVSVVVSFPGIEVDERRSGGAPARGVHRAIATLIGRRAVGAAAAALVLAVTLVTALIITVRHDHRGTGSHDQAAAHGHTDHAVPDGGAADAAQIELVRTAMARYEDIQVAYAEGWVQEHPDYPETGAHFVRDSDWIDTGPVRPDLDPVDPEFLMYSRIGRDDWELVAVAYVVDQALYPEPPTDLRGASYHEHVWNCVADGEELEEEDFGVISRDECREREGEWSPGAVWMTHVWLIENPAGVFAETNPDLV